MPSLKQHGKLRSRAGPNLAMPVALTFGFGLLVLSLFEFRPFLAFYEWGNQLRAGDTSTQLGQFTYVRVNHAPANASGLALSVDVRTGPSFAWPQYAIWVETMEGEFIQVLYVTHKLAENNFSTKSVKKDSNLVFTSNLATSGELDSEQLFNFKNEYYSSNRFPDDPIYSGDGYSAQPSVVYETVIDPASLQTYYPMTLVGHGHHSGKDGLLYKDLKNLTTALQILDRIIVEVGKPTLQQPVIPRTDAK
jgi:hypothetical protein